MRVPIFLYGVLVLFLLLGGCDGGSGSHNNGGVVPPPITPPDETLTGFLFDSAVSGVAYATRTRQGVTGVDGSFQYEKGENVRFFIGDTVLGDVLGQQQVSPFTLAGSAAVTGGSNIAAALGNRNDTFQAVVNIATLLQSLDQDGNPDNGIEIDPDVVALFAGVNLDVSQYWKTFRNQYDLRHALEQANEQSLFSGPHGVANPAAAVQHLYQSLDLDAHIFLISRWESKIKDSNYNSTRIQRWYYDLNGYLTEYAPYSMESPAGGFSIGYQYVTDGPLARIASPASLLYGDDRPGNLYGYKYEYDTRGNLTRIETETLAKDTNPYVGFVESTTSSTENLQYDFVGNVTQIERKVKTVSLITDGVPSEELPATTNEIWQYDASGNLTRYQADADGDGEPDHIQKWDFDVKGNLTRYQEEEGDGTPDHIEIWENQYNDLGRLTQVKYDADPSGSGDVVGDGIPLSIATYQYDVNAKLTRIELNGEYLNAAAEAINIPYIGYLELAETYILTYEYDADGNVIQEIRDAFSSTYGRHIVKRQYGVRVNVTREEDHLMPLSPDEPKRFSLEEYKYNEIGDVIRRTADFDGDGTPEIIQNWQYEYDSNGYLIHYESDFNSNTFQYEPTGWGHIFASPPPYPVLAAFGYGSLVWPGASSPIDWYLD